MTIEFVNIPYSYNLTSEERDYFEHEYDSWSEKIRPLNIKRQEYCADFCEKFSDSVSARMAVVMADYAHKLSARLVAGLRDTWFPQDYCEWLDSHGGEHFIPPESRIPYGVVIGSTASLTAAFLFELVHRMRDAIGIKGRDFVMAKVGGFYAEYIRRISPRYQFLRRDGSREDLFAHELSMFSRDQTNNIHKKHSLGFYDKARRPTTVAYDVWSEYPDGALVSTEEIGRWAIRRLSEEDYRPTESWCKNTLMVEMTNVLSVFDSEVQTGLMAYEMLYDKIVAMEKECPLWKAREVSESRRRI